MSALISIIADWMMFPLFFIAIILIVMYTPRKERFNRYTRIVMAGLTSYVAAKVVAQIYQPNEERPFQELGVEAGASFLNNPGFPSDHMLFAMFLAIAVWYATRNTVFFVVLAAMAVAVGLGRVLALVHTPLDVIGGAVIATIGILWYGQKRKKVVK